MCVPESGGDATVGFKNVKATVRLCLMRLINCDLCYMFHKEGCEVGCFIFRVIFFQAKFLVCMSSPLLFFSAASRVNLKCYLAPASRFVRSF